MNALIIEDDENMTTVLASWLERMGYTVVTTDKIETAARIIKEHPELEIVTLDLNLTDSQAENTVQRIAELRALNPNAFLVVISGVLTSQDEQRITAMGADGFMEKHDVPTERSFFGKLRDVLVSLGRTPSKYARNIPLIEAIALNVAKRCDELKCTIGGAPPVTEPVTEPQASNESNLNRRE